MECKCLILEVVVPLGLEPRTPCQYMDTERQVLVKQKALAYDCK